MVQFLCNGQLPDQQQEAKKLAALSSLFTAMEGISYDKLENGREVVVQVIQARCIHGGPMGGLYRTYNSRVTTGGGNVCIVTLSSTVRGAHSVQLYLDLEGETSRS